MQVIGQLHAPGNKQYKSRLRNSIKEKIKRTKQSSSVWHWWHI